MYYKFRKMQSARKRITEQLKALGWQERECEPNCKPNDRVELRASYLSPHISNGFFEFENCLKKFNTGEAYWRTETLGLQLSHLAWRCHEDNPNNHHWLHVDDAFEEARRMMLHGIDFEYEDDEVEGQINHETVRFIDWEQPERNTFEYVVGWRGAKNDGFAWDVILLINSIPVGGIVLEGAKHTVHSTSKEPSPDDEDYISYLTAIGSEGLTESAPCQNAFLLAFNQLMVDYQFPVYCHSLIIGNGKQLMIGDPWMELEEFLPIEHLEDVLQPTEFLMNRIKNF